MFTKEEFVKTFEKEFATTQKVMKAYPADKLDFLPHEKSNSALRLLKTLVFGLVLMERGMGGAADNDFFKGYNPGSLEQLLQDFNSHVENVSKMLKDAGESDFQKEMQFAGATFKLESYLMMLLFDQVHHRGQLTVYIRLAGGLVPAVYGPTADDKNTNL